jgi:mono/diheme cytochrome c family protein
LAGYPRLTAVTDATASLEQRARSYLDVNCAQCHRPGGVRSEFDARFETPLERQKLIGGKLVAADLGIPGAVAIAPGDRSRSMIYQRMKRRQDVFNMPPLASHQVDATALEVVGQWIDSLSNAECGMRNAERGGRNAE